ncbi:MAG: ABC transporter permease subunit [Burkholderiales bacterium]|nr:ABC transporter permease subunit [Burkholderiales bacterium]
MRALVLSEQVVGRGRWGIVVVVGLLAAIPCTVCAEDARPVVIGSKRFTESYLLGEIARETLQRASVVAVHRQGLGNTAVLFEALSTGAIDTYPDYTGTIGRELLKTEATDLESLNRALAPLGLGAGVPLGFENTYAVATRDGVAAAKLSELAAQPGLRIGLSPEFLHRADGWPAIARVYGLPQQPTVLDHGLAYEALAAGRVDAMDIYSTDAKIAKYRLHVLEDDRRVFPEYRAVWIYRLDLPRRSPAAWSALQSLQGRIAAHDMIQMNAAAELEGRSFDVVARDFLDGGRAPAATRSGLAARLFAADLPRLTREHLVLVFGSLALACLAGIPLGIAAAGSRRLAQPVLAATGLIQTVPSLALLAFLIPLTGTIGTLPAVVALFLYSLLPIVRATHAALTGIARNMRESAVALGLNRFQRLRFVELPLALPGILSGVKTSAVINVGTATIAAFIGAGGYGERITAGLALNDNAMLLAGAIPAAVLALVVHAIFELAERRVAR